MILEGFEIENWGCLGRLVVENLPATGVVVLHGPNGTGKTSIIEALRACLMDKKSTSKALGRGWPKNSTAKPKVSVTFRTNGTTWRITKQFGSKESSLESRTATGQWRLETADATEAHDRAAQLAGGDDSRTGLQQLLWLTQAEFHLPTAKDFDTSVQSRLRAVLGVLQTALDDRFIEHVKSAWSKWFSGTRKPGENPKLKKTSMLDRELQALEERRNELAGYEAKYRESEALIDRSAALQIESRELERQLNQRTKEYEGLRSEYESSLTRLDAHRHAAEKVIRSEKMLADARASKLEHANKEQMLVEMKRLFEMATSDAESKQQRIQAALQNLTQLKQEKQLLADAGRTLQARLQEVSRRRELVELRERAATTRENLKQAEQAACEVEALKRQLREHPAPENALLDAMEKNRHQCTQQHAKLHAEAIAVTLVTDQGAARAKLTVDGKPVPQGESGTGTESSRHAIRRHAEIAIPGWGRAEISRGSDARSLDDIEKELNNLERAFAEGLAPFGIPASDPAALDHLRTLAAEKKAREPELRGKETELKRLAPKGLDQLRQDLTQLENRLLAKEAAPEGTACANGLPKIEGDPENLAASLESEINASHTREREIENAIALGESALEARDGLRHQESRAREKVAAQKAEMEALSKEIERMGTTSQLEMGIQDAEQEVARARTELEATKLSADEETVRERLEAANQSVRGHREMYLKVQKDFHELRGRLLEAEGLHQDRAAAAARVEELALKTVREKLEADAYDRLYALFEECRDKQLSTVMTPIHDRVLRWMRLLRIGDYQSIHFNDQFLPEKLLLGNGAVELEMGEESTGTIEQIGLMVRLSLGSALSRPEEPVVALLDDPLTHSDRRRLDLMRAVLRSAAGGDPGVTPPAGPLQILVFTCHPEWFHIDGARIIDLADPKVLSRQG